VVHDDREQAVEVQLAVQRLRDALQAQEAVLLVLRARHLLLDVEDHRVAAVGERGGRRGLLEEDARVADADLVADLQRRAVHEVAVERRPVLAAEVVQHVLRAVPLDAAVGARRAEVEHRDVALRPAPDDDHVLVHLEDRASLVLVEHESGHRGDLRLPAPDGRGARILRIPCESARRKRR
jgi:hypothetical protein